MKNDWGHGKKRHKSTAIIPLSIKKEISTTHEICKGSMKLDKKDVTPMRASTRREHAADHRAITICHKDKKRGRWCIINAAAKNAIKSHSQAKK